MTAFREKPSHVHAQLAKKLDVTELMSRPTVIPARRFNVFPELDVRELVFGYRANGNHKLPPAESLGDFYVRRLDRQGQSVDRGASRIGPSDTEEQGSASGARPSSPEPPPQGALDDYVELIANILSGTATEADMATWANGVRQYPWLQAAFDSARQKVKKSFPWISGG
jgi:hypothetical protein